MTLTRALPGLLGLMLLAALATTWVMTRPEPPTQPWVSAVSVLAGNGQNGWRDGPADVAKFSEPFGLVGLPDGSVLVSDAGSSHRIRRIALDGSVTTLAGSARGLTDGRGASARFATPSAIALAPDGSLVVADTGNHAIRRVQPDGAVTTVAGNGVAGYVDGPAAQAQFNAPVGVAVDPHGRIVVADTYNDRIRVIEADGHVRTLAGGAGVGSDDGPGPSARFDTPSGVAVDTAGRVLVADTGNGAIRAIAPDGLVTTIGGPIVGLTHPMALVATALGDVYVVEERGSVILLPAQGEPRLLAGGAPGFADGHSVDAAFRRPSSIAIVPDAGRQARSPAPPRLAVADAGNALVRLVRPTGHGVSAPGRSSAAWWPLAGPHLPVPRRPLHTPAFDVEAFARTPLLWPVAPLEGPHEVAGTFGEARGGAGQERFHAGLDVREEQGTPVRALRDGIVSSPIATSAFGTVNESVRIGDLAYVHVRVGRERPGPASRRAETGSRDARALAPRTHHEASPTDLQRFAPVYDASGVLTRVRAKRGAFFATGDVIGTVNAFNHVHLNVGWSGEEHNPLRFRLVQFRDGIAPTIAAHGVRLFNQAWQPLNPDRVGPSRGRGRKRRPVQLPPAEPVVVRGQVRIVVDAWDQADGNRAYRRLGVYALGYGVGPSGAAQGTARVTQVFERMRRGSEAARQVYATGSGIPVYGASRTQFLYVATTGYRDGIAADGVWDTTTLRPGEYVLRVFVADFSGNRTTRDLKVLVVH